MAQKKSMTAKLIITPQDEVTTRNLLLTTAIIETVFAIPVLGGAFILLTAWIALIAALIFHIISLIYCVKTNTSKAGNILGIVASVFGWIPFLGWLLHIITAILLWRAWAKVK